MTLTEFLLARITEDEENLSALRELKVWESECQPIGLRRFEGEIEAKRRLVNLATYVSDMRQVPTSRPGVYDVAEEREPYSMGMDEWAEATEVLRLLTLPYADHPDFDEEWRA